MNKKAPAALAVLLVLFVSSLLAQEPQPSQMREELIKLNYVRVRDSGIQSLLMPFSSREGRMSISESQNMIGLRDYPQNVEKILAFIKKIDLKPTDLLFTVQLVLASSGDDIRTEEALAGDPVIKELRAFLKYKNFALLDTSLVRAMDREYSAVTLGSRETEFTLRFYPVFIREENSEIIKLEVSLNQRMGFVKGEDGAERLYQKTLLESNLSLKPGDKTVVGVSKLDGGDKALILILSGKVVK